MGGPKSIGSLFIDIEARTAKLEEDMGRVKKIVNGTKESVASQGEEWAKLDARNAKMMNSLASRVAGAISIFALMKREIAFVSANIDRIPGIPAETRASIKEMQHDLSEARNSVDVFIAKGIAGFNFFAKALGASLGALDDNFYQARNADSYFQDMEDGLKAMKDDLDEVAQQQDVTYGDKVTAAMSRLAEEKKKLARASMTEADQITFLRREAELWNKFATSSNFNRLHQTEARITAVQREATASEKFRTMQDQLLEQEKRVTASLDKRNVVGLSTNEQVRIYDQLVTKLRNSLIAINAALARDPQNPTYLQQKIDATHQLADAQESLNGALKKQGELARQVGDALASNIGDAIMRGEGLHEMLNNILADILKIVLQKSIIGPLADMFTGGLGSLFKVGKSAAGGPIGRGPRLVGEHGPEVIDNQGYSTVIPNDRLSGGGGAGRNYYIDARGADEAAIQRLEKQLMQLAGPGVVERRAVGAHVSAKWRRGAVGNSL